MEKSSSLAKKQHLSVPKAIQDNHNIRKIVFLGDQGVGKTSLINRFISNSMPSGKHKQPTIGAEEYKR